jgi:hypothetical protein
MTIKYFDTLKPENFINVPAFSFTPNPPKKKADNPFYINSIFPLNSKLGKDDGKQYCFFLSPSQIAYLYSKTNFYTKEVQAAKKNVKHKNYKKDPSKRSFINSVLASFFYSKFNDKEKSLISDSIRSMASDYYHDNRFDKGDKSRLDLPRIKPFLKDFNELVKKINENINEIKSLPDYKF